MPKKTHIKGMSNNTLYILLFVVFIVIVGGGWMMYRKNVSTSTFSNAYNDGISHSANTLACHDYCNKKYKDNVTRRIDCKGGCDNKGSPPLSGGYNQDRYIR